MHLGDDLRLDLHVAPQKADQLFFGEHERAREGLEPRMHVVATHLRYLLRDRVRCMRGGAESACAIEIGGCQRKARRERVAEARRGRGGWM